MKIGNKVQITSDNENYISYLNQPLTIAHIARNTDEHPGYDEGLKGEPLFDLKTKSGEDVPFSLYLYEVESV